MHGQRDIIMKTTHFSTVNAVSAQELPFPKIYQWRENKIATFFRKLHKNEKNQNYIAASSRSVRHTAF